MERAAQPRPHAVGGGRLTAFNENAAASAAAAFDRAFAPGRSNGLTGVRALLDNIPMTSAASRRSSPARSMPRLRCSSRPTCCARHDARSVALAEIPEICVLDPDGDILRALRGNGDARCPRLGLLSHRALRVRARRRCGSASSAAPSALFAVLLAEQLFVSGCRFLISVTSAGQIVSRDRRHISS